jgi:hypothetical protein
MGRPSEPRFPTPSEPRVSILVNPGSHIPEAEGQRPPMRLPLPTRSRLPQPVAKHGSQGDRTRAVFTFCDVDDRSNGDDANVVTAAGGLLALVGTLTEMILGNLWHAMWRAIR